MSKLLVEAYGAGSDSLGMVGAVSNKPIVVA